MPSTVQAAKANFANDYAAVVALGKAIPTSVDMPSLLVQLEQAAAGTGIELDGIAVGERTTVAGLPPPRRHRPVPGAPDPAAAPQSAPGAAVASAEGAAAAATTPPADPAAGTDPAAAPTGTDPAVAGATGTAPAADALESVSLEFNFSGDFFELADFFHSLKRFVFVEGDKVRVRGRLLTIDSVEYVTEAGESSRP